MSPFYISILHTVSRGRIILSFVLVISLSILPAVPAFAQLEDVTPTTETTTTTTETITETIAPADTTAPVISGVANLSLGLGEATIAWTTDELAVSRLEYGTTQSYGQEAILDATALLAHTTLLTGLAFGTTYYYCIHATDLAGNTSSSCGHEFITAAESSSSDGTSVITDTTPPDISLITVTSINSDSVTINWTTDTVATGQVEYGTTAAYGEVTTLDSALSLIHSVTITGLTPNTEYHYRIRSADEIGNTATSSDNVFTTASLVSGEVTTTTSETSTTGTVGDTSTSSDTTLLISSIETVAISSSAVTITWLTDLPADSQIEYGESVNLGSLTTLSSELLTSHSITITDLSPGTNYIFRVKSKPVGALIATVSDNHSFSTLSPSTPIVASANITSVAVSDISTSDATISWITNKGATSQVEYGLSTSYGETSSFNSILGTTHSIALANLDPGTTYHYRVKSVDEVGNTTFSNDHTFITAASSVSVSAPASLSTLVIGNYDQSSVDLTWTLGAGSIDISYEYDIRYSTSPITEANYENATKAQFTPVYHSDLNPEGTLRTYTIAGLSQNTIYYFAVRSRHQTSEWSGLSNSVFVTTLATASSGNTAGGSTGRSAGRSFSGFAVSFSPTIIKAQPADSQIIFQWNNPGNQSFVRTVLVRKEGGYPQAPSDGDTIYEGRSTTFTDTDVENGTNYYYALYSYNYARAYSAPTLILLAPNAVGTEVQFNVTGSLGSSVSAIEFTRLLQREDRGAAVERLQRVLVTENVSFPRNLVTGYFGPLTEGALRRFQAKYAILQTGVVDTATQEKLNIVTHEKYRLKIPGTVLLYSADLAFGARGEAVRVLQRALAADDVYPEKLVTGYFGPLTERAVKVFQAKYSITPVSGYVGPKTRQKLQQLAGF